MSYLTEITELVTAILVGVVFSIFMSAFCILILVLHRNSSKGTNTPRSDGEGGGLKDNFKTMPEITLLKPVSSDMMRDNSDASLTEELFENFENYDATVNDPQWAQEATTLVTHCMAVLVNCRMLTEKLTSLAMNMLDEWDPQMGKLVEIAKLITLRVDQLVNCMRPPLNPHALEARAASLTLAVTHLAIMTQHVCRIDQVPAEWISKMLNNIQRHIDVSKEHREMLTCDTQNFFHNKDSFQILK